MAERPTFDTDFLIGDRFFPFCHEIITKVAIWMVACGRIMKTRKTDIAPELRHESSSNTYYMTNIIFIHLVEWNFEYDMFRTNGRFV